MLKNKLKLILPNRKYAASYLRALKEFAEEGTSVAEGPHRIRIFHSIKDWPKYLKVVTEERKGSNVPKDRVPASMYWAVVKNKVVGRVHIRHTLNAGLRIIGGHIGYAVVPSERKKGYATEMLRTALKITKKMGIKKALVTCDEKNIASRKVIEANGGILFKKLKDKEKGTILQFWVK
jgi:predicted acetyltransferase